jgi:glycosyltransferase involved in cell wall biosynthesis
MARDTVLISVGRLDKNKNNSTLIKAVALCNNPSVHLVICGDGEERDFLSNLARELGVGPQIHFLGNRSDMKELYTMADVFVMASYREGLSRSIMEAMASGLPCIASDIRGNRDLIQNGKGGFLVPCTDVSAFSEAISRVVEGLEIRLKMSEYNLERIKEFDIEVVEKQIQEIYQEVMGG